MKSLMSWFACLILLGISTSSVAAQTSAAATAQLRQMQEQVTKLSAKVNELLESQEVQRRKIQNLEGENRRLSKRLTDSGNSGVSPADLNELSQAIDKRIRKVDDNRVAGDKQLQSEFNNRIDKLVDVVTKGGAKGQPPVVPAKYELYLVQPGDTLDAIRRAVKKAYGVTISVNDILRANGISDPKSLRAGEEIKIPIP